MSSFGQDPSQGDMGMKTVREGGGGEGMKNLRKSNKFNIYTAIFLVRSYIAVKKGYLTLTGHESHHYNSN